MCKLKKKEKKKLKVRFSIYQHFFYSAVYTFFFSGYLDTLKKAFLGPHTHSPVSAQTGVTEVSAPAPDVSLWEAPAPILWQSNSEQWASDQRERNSCTVLPAPTPSIPNLSPTLHLPTLPTSLHKVRESLLFIIIFVRMDENLKYVHSVSLWASVGVGAVVVRSVKKFCSTNWKRISQNLRGFSFIG